MPVDKLEAVTVADTSTHRVFVLRVVVPATCDFAGEVVATEVNEKTTRLNTLWRLVDQTNAPAGKANAIYRVSEQELSALVCVGAAPPKVLGSLVTQMGISLDQSDGGGSNLCGPLSLADAVTGMLGLTVATSEELAQKTVSKERIIRGNAVRAFLTSVTLKQPEASVG